MIISGGENVHPREIEELLTNHPQIDDTAALGVEDPEFGQRLAVFCVPAPGATLSPDEVREYVRTNLPRYEVPRDVTFPTHLPRSPAGKTLKRQLTQRITSIE